MHIRRRVRKLRRRSRNMGFEPDITTGWLRNKIKTQKICMQTGERFDLSDPLGPLYPTVDRVDNDLGYTKDNCQLVTMIYNRSKYKYPSEIFDFWARKLVEEN